MQFITVAIFAAAAAASVVTETDVTSTLVTITSCGPEVTSCPAKIASSSSVAAHNSTVANVTTFEGSANKQFAAGAVALAAGALLAL